MQDLIRQVLSILGGMWKYRWLGLAAAWVVAVLCAGVAMKGPNQYEASARIFVDTQSILKPLMQGLAIQPNVDQQVAMLSRTLISRPNLEKLGRMADLDLKSATKADQEALIERLGRSLAIRSTGRDNLYTLSYRDPDKERAKRVIQSLVSIFVETSLGSSRKDTDAAKTFLDEQIKAHEARHFDEAETKLKEFKIRNIELQNAEGRDSAAQLAQVRQQLTQARLELKEAENSRDAAKQQIKAEKEGTIVNCASVSADPRTCASTRVVNPAIALTKSAPSDVVICDPIPMTLVVKNAGSSGLAEVRVTDTLPEGLLSDGKIS